MTQRAIIVQPESDEPDVIDSEPVMVVDTTAELLGRAKPKRPRARAGTSPHQTGAHRRAHRDAKAGARPRRSRQRPLVAPERRSPGNSSSD